MPKKTIVNNAEIKRRLAAYFKEEKIQRHTMRDVIQMHARPKKKKGAQ